MPRDKEKVVRELSYLVRENTCRKFEGLNQILPDMTTVRGRCFTVVLVLHASTMYINLKRIVSPPYFKAPRRPLFVPVTQIVSYCNVILVGLLSLKYCTYPHSPRSAQLSL